MYCHTRPITEHNPDSDKDTIATKDKAAHCFFCEGEHGTFAGGRGGACIKRFKLD